MKLKIFMDSGQYADIEIDDKLIELHLSGYEEDQKDYVLAEFLGKETIPYFEAMLKLERLK